jgi:hypothetical protein
MSLLANAKAVAGAVICGTGATSGLVLYPLRRKGRLDCGSGHRGWIRRGRLAGWEEALR